MKASSPNQTPQQERDTVGDYVKSVQALREQYHKERAAADRYIEALEAKIKRLEADNDVLS